MNACVCVCTDEVLGCVGVSYETKCNNTMCVVGEVCIVLMNASVCVLFTNSVCWLQYHEYAVCVVVCCVHGWVQRDDIMNEHSMCQEW